MIFVLNIIFYINDLGISYNAPLLCLLLIFFERRRLSQRFLMSLILSYVSVVNGKEASLPIAAVSSMDHGLKHGLRQPVGYRTSVWFLVAAQIMDIHMVPNWHHEPSWTLAWPPVETRTIDINKTFNGSRNHRSLSRRVN